MNQGYGLIATLVRDGDVVARHFPVEPERRAGRGKPLLPGSATSDAVRDLVAFCDAGGWKVRVVSTPHTIARDLNGHREHGSAGDAPTTTAFPEPHYLPARLIERVA